MNSLNDLKRRLKVCVSFPDDERSREISKRQFINLELDTVNSARKNAERSVNFVYALFISIFSIDARQRFHAAQNRRLFLDFYRRLSKKLTVCVCVYVCMCVPHKHNRIFSHHCHCFKREGTGVLVTNYCVSVEHLPERQQLFRKERIARWMHAE